jgi:O-antigen ligase
VAVLFLVLAQSTGGMLVAGMLGLVVVARRWIRPLGVGVLLLPTLLVAVGSAAAIGGLLDGVLTAFGKDPTLTGRTEIWEQTMRLLSERPLLGHSMASFWQLDIVERTGIWFSNAHNGYLQLLIDLGLVGLATFVLHLLTTLVRSLRWARLRDWAAPWPHCMAVFLLVYNLIEVSVVKESSIVWVLYVSASLAVRSPAVRAVHAVRGD